MSELKDCELRISDRHILHLKPSGKSVCVAAEAFVCARHGCCSLHLLRCVSNFLWLWQWDP